VGVDHTFYHAPTEDYWRRLFLGTPSLLFALKAPEHFTVHTWPKHARYGTRAGQPNAEFLNARLFRTEIADRLAPYRDRVAVVMFEFGTFNKSAFPTPADYLARLDPFLKALPSGLRYGIEIRNREYLTPDYCGVLKERNVAHVFNSWTRMPGLMKQGAIGEAFTADFAVVRALLTPGRTYQKAVEQFEPYRLVQEVDELAREGMAQIAGQARERKKPAFLLVNDRLEGHAPTMIEATADRLF
jgi:uncharacterized protein YecE (DUF72 family)